MSEKSVLIGISGGVDSAVAAYLLEMRGYRVEGLYIDNGFPSASNDAAARVADALSIPLHRREMSDRFRKEIVGYFVDEYCNARTPNPCVVCNKKIKFASLLDEARTRGIDHIATGHYASIDNLVSDQGRCLRRGKDRTKDQTYFLFMLGQTELASLLLPLGGLSKMEVRKIGGDIGLGVSTERESQEICFIPDDDYRRFIEEHLPFPPGDIVTTDGRVVGRHRGIHSLTIGQRRGLAIPSERPYYVVEIRKEANQVVVGREEEQYFSGLVAQSALWISPRYAERGDMRCRIFIRYRHGGVESDVRISGDGTVTVSFDTPQKAVAPGQAAVFYDGDVLIGGGWIERGLRHD
jgi:tRNA-specific 2-thiouridylase